MPSFSEYYWAGRRGHLIGVGGVSMSPLAEVLAEAGLVITGSDMNEGANVAHLRSLGIPVFIGHRAENIPADAGICRPHPPPCTTKTRRSLRRTAAGFRCLSARRRGARS